MSSSAIVIQTLLPPLYRKHPPHHPPLSPNLERPASELLPPRMFRVLTHRRNWRHRTLVCRRLAVGR